VHQAEKLSLEEIGRFVEASEGLRFEGEGREQVYGWIERVLCQQEYAGQGKGARGLLRRYIEKMTGMSRAQVTRLLARYRAGGGDELSAASVLFPVHTSRRRVVG
jgi:hypothetical protein